MSVTAEPVLLKQYKLLGAVIDAPWATRLDHKIARHVIDRYFAKFGNARASLSYLEQATGAKRTNIVESLRRISDPRHQGRRSLSLLRLAASSRSRHTLAGNSHHRGGRA